MLYLNVGRYDGAGLGYRSIYWIRRDEVRVCSWLFVLRDADVYVHCAIQHSDHVYVLYDSANEDICLVSYCRKVCHRFIKILPQSFARIGKTSVFLMKSIVYSCV